MKMFAGGTMIDWSARLPLPVTVGLLCGLFFTDGVAAGAKFCKPSEAEAADAAIDTLDSWGKIDAAFKKYGHCDDGSIAEGNSEAVARLLVDRWDTLPALGKLISKRPALEGFVLRHIDSTLDTGDLERISALGEAQCPANMRSFCKSLVVAADKAMK